MLEDIKKILGITSDDEDINRQLELKINAVVDYLANAGASYSAIQSNAGITCVALGVNDLLNNKAGETKLSPAFNIFALQITRG